MGHQSTFSRQPGDETIESQHERLSVPALRDHVGAFVPGKITEWPATGTGALNGLSCGVKDVFDIAGCATGYGNPEWEQTHPVPTVDAIAVSMLRRDGAHMVGKTVTDELAFSLAGNNFHYGSPTNTAAPARLTGGSSCGSAAAVAAGLCDFALGTDTAGSVRAPASYCGVFGVRPTLGVISTEGVCRLAPSFDAVGWLSRDASTLASVGHVLLPERLRSDELDGWLSFHGAWAALPDATQQMAAPLLRDLQLHLGECRSLALEIHELDEFVNAFRTIQFYEVWNELGHWFGDRRPILGPDIYERMLLASKVTREEYLAASAAREQIKSRLNDFLEGGQIIVMPTVSGPAPLRASSAAELNRQRQADLRFLTIASLAGLPQVSLPLLTADEAPLGVSLIGAAGSDKSLLALAERLEANGALQHPR